MLGDLILICALVPIVIALLTLLSVRLMSARPELLPAPELAEALRAAVSPVMRQVLQRNGFEFAEAYKFHNVELGVWLKRDANVPVRRFSFLRTNDTSTFELITEFSDNTSLTTSKSRSAFFLPRPYGGFVQSFPSKGHEELLSLHGEGERYLVEQRGVEIIPFRLTFLERFRTGAARQFALIRSTPLWPIRGIYWFLLKRFLLQNKPIWEQDLDRLYPKVS